MALQQERFDLPGFTLPLDCVRHESNNDGIFDRDWLFPNALEEEGDADGFLYTFREILMMRVMNTITDKPDWERKVFNEDITNKWRKEVSESGQGVSKAMMDWIVKELQWKTDGLKKDCFISVFDNGVVKSDCAISEDLKRQLMEGAAPFENIPEDQKDYHPGSDNQVLDLVHQSLFPLVYGRTHILRDRVIGLDDCLNSVGQGEVLPVPPRPKLPVRYHAQSREPYPISWKFQWLPCDVEFNRSEPGSEPECRITSYINNVHPLEHKALYRAIEKILDRTIPLWNQSLTRSSQWGERIADADQFYYAGEHEEPEPVQGEDEDERVYWDRREDWAAARLFVLPEPHAEFRPPNQHPVEERLDLRKKFKDTGLQVIVKLANIELTPDKPEYNGGNWHVEGQLNERICATAIYYYASENITQSTLCFRHRTGIDLTDGFSYEQHNHYFLQQIFGFPGRGTNFGDNPNGMTQELGEVVCRENRLLTFPNVLQHRVSPFSLADRSRPGHRKILALFLVDPHVRIISSANIPPQQEEWSQGRQGLIDGLLRERLPVELQEIVRKDMPKSTMSLEEAKRYRLELMEERSVKSEEHNQVFTSGEFFLCEH
ncbi:uncharacterized protein N7477_005956 [Penicillium maclennaniae]|uniref:uncharacterized protein n=1 Tax=Penicillium maclennaniae TaxID=1343394 RepID=UPI0025420F68|nr:uncharacterized protein N7477_005956 [Penicillium maclennaniae]KAJ5670593.1 hypothetical protein N7477_005956 [Penicillium maclennaniae]